MNKKKIFLISAAFTDRTAAIVAFCVAIAIGTRAIAICAAAVYSWAFAIMYGTVHFIITIIYKNESLNLYLKS